jgi:hypothetical protein
MLSSLSIARFLIWAQNRRCGIQRHTIYHPRSNRARTMVCGHSSGRCRNSGQGRYRTASIGRASRSFPNRRMASNAQNTIAQLKIQAERLPKADTSFHPMGLFCRLGESGFLEPTYQFHRCCAAQSAVRPSTKSTIQRRSFRSLISLNALMSDSPSGVAVNLEISASDRSSRIPFDFFPEGITSSKKKETGTCKKLAICCRRLAPMRFVPFSYFCTCWNVRPSAPASAV